MDKKAHIPTISPRAGKQPCTYVHCSFMSLELPVLHYRFTGRVSELQQFVMIVKSLSYSFLSLPNEFVHLQKNLLCILPVLIISAGRFLFTLKQMKMPVHVPSFHPLLMFVEGFKKNIGSDFISFP